MAKKGKKEKDAAKPAEQQPQLAATKSAPTPTEPDTSAPTAPNSPSLFSLFLNNDAQKGIQLVILAAVYSHLSQLSLSPVYGAVPSASYHKYGSYAAVMLPIFIRGQVQQRLPKLLAESLPTFAFWIPTIQFVLFKYSATLGVTYGPLITELLTYYPLVILSIFVSGTYFDKLDLGQFGATVAEIGPSSIAFLIFIFSQRVLTQFFLRNIGSNLMFTRVGLQLVVGSFHALLVPSSLFAASVPSIAFTMLANVHSPLQRTTDVLNGTLALQGYTLIDRAESVTGYLSVLENTHEHFRVMRCDHSLLGGEWTLTTKKDSPVKEPIYGVFAMLEAARLVVPAAGDTTPAKSDAEKQALNIGLGIGTAPSGLIAHGIPTTIIEIDPVVHRFAMQHFALPNHTYVIGDAALVLNDWSHTNSYTGKYDIILHDCFSAGGVAPELFTVEFFSDLREILSNTGVVAINYAGDLANPALSSLIYRTITTVFPSCRVFRESAPIILAPGQTDLTNMVIFCHKGAGRLNFRKAVEADCLGSGAREQFLKLEHEIPANRFERTGEVLRKGKTKVLERWQAQSAAEHWKVMRRVLPDSVWENW